MKRRPNRPITAKKTVTVLVRVLLGILSVAAALLELVAGVLRALSRLVARALPESLPKNVRRAAPEVGPRRARVVVEMRTPKPAPVRDAEPDVAERVQFALKKLGYKPSVVARVVGELDTSKGSMQELIREGLRRLAA